MQLTSGTGNGAIDILYHDRFTIAASGTQNIDLDLTTNDNVFGTIAAMVKVRGLAFANTSDELAVATDSNITLTGDWITTTYGASASIPIDAGGMFGHLHKDGLTVTATSADVITITNADGSNQAQVDVWIAGSSS
jgi:hypothetical protein